MDQEHIFFQYKNTGMSRWLRGIVLTEIVFITEDNSLWTQKEMDDFYWVCKRAFYRLEDQAKEAGVPLQFSAMVGRYVYDGVMNPNSLSQTIRQIQNRYLAEQGFSNSAQYVQSRRRNMNATEVATIFVLERKFRAFARTGDDLECCALTQDDDEHAIMHEMLHLFGAVDLYYPYHIYGLTMKRFPKSVMCTYEGNVVDPLTQYLIGWVDVLPAKARLFMKEVGEYSAESYRHALTLESYRGKEELLQQYLAPYQSLANLMKGSLQDDPWADFLLGVCFRDGIMVEKSVEKAERCFLRSGKSGLVLGAYEYARMLLCRQRSAAENEEVKLVLTYCGYDHLMMEMMRLGCYYTGEVYARNQKFAIDTAISYYQNTEAYAKYAQRSQKLYVLAEKLSSRLPQLHAVVQQMRRQYDQAMQQDDPNLQFAIARLLEEGIYLKKDLVGAFTLYSVAAKAGNFRSSQELSRCYREGIGTARDVYAARQWEVKSRLQKEQDPWNAFCYMM